MDFWQVEVARQKIKQLMHEQERAMDYEDRLTRSYWKHGFCGMTCGKAWGRMGKARCGPWLFLCGGGSVQSVSWQYGRYDDHEIPNMDNILPWWSCIAVIRSTVIPVMVATMKMLIHADSWSASWSVCGSTCWSISWLWIMMLSNDSYLVVNDLWQEAAEARCRSCIKERRGWRLTKDLEKSWVIQTPWSLPWSLGYLG